MFSQFQLSASTEDRSTLDWGRVEFESLTRDVVALGKRKASLRTPERAQKVAKTQTVLRCYAQPQLLARRVDEVTRRVTPHIERLPLESHCFDLALEPYDPAHPHDPTAQYQPPVALPALPPAPLAVTTPKPVAPPTTPLPPVATPTLVNGGTTVIRRPVKVPVKPLPPLPIVTKAPETALVRLASGKLMRVPMEFLQRHQPQLLQGRRTLVSMAQPVSNGLTVSTVGLSMSAPVPTPNTLSRVLEKISPTISSSLLPTTPIPPQIQRIASSAAATTTTTSMCLPSTMVSSVLPANVVSLLQQNGTIVPGGPSRVIRIKAYQSPNPSTISQTINGLQTPVAAKLSDRLSAITPVVSSSNLPMSNMVTIPHSLQSYVLQPNSPVRLRTTADVMTKSIPTTSQFTTADGQKLSVALTKAIGLPPSGTTTSSLLDKVIVFGSNGTAQLINGSGGPGTQRQLVQTSSGLQLAPMPPKTILIKTANGIAQGNIVMGHPVQQQQQQQQPRLNPAGDMPPAKVLSMVADPSRAGGQMLLSPKVILPTAPASSSSTTTMVGQGVFRTVVPGPPLTPSVSHVTNLASGLRAAVKVNSSPLAPPNVLLGAGDAKQTEDPLKKQNEL
eukprot:maker-scaffold21_size687808-snap-gene-5.43 protein:Tk09847 transcript:maker-scaffold21_size687808-snap-gene-5.43-mRNA-1 annotation:"---NA---"